MRALKVFILATIGMAILPPSAASAGCATGAHCDTIGNSLLQLKGRMSKIEDKPPPRMPLNEDEEGEYDDEPPLNEDEDEPPPPMPSLNDDEPPLNEDEDEPPPLVPLLNDDEPPLNEDEDEPPPVMPPRNEEERIRRLEAEVKMLKEHMNDDEPPLNEDEDEPPPPMPPRNEDEEGEDLYEDEDHGDLNEMEDNDVYEDVKLVQNQMEDEMGDDDVNIVLSALRQNASVVKAALQEQFLEQSSAAKRRFKAQKAWAAHSMISLEAGACKRRKKGRQPDRGRHWQKVKKKNIWDRGTCPLGWENFMGRCLQPCKDLGGNNEWEDSKILIRGCRHKCPVGWKFSGGFCHRPCSDYPGFDTTCGPLYCTVDSQACMDKAVTIGLAFADMLSNLYLGLSGPAKSGMKVYAKQAKKQGMKAAAWAAIKRATLKATKKYARKFARKLVKNEIMTPLKTDGKSLAQSEKAEILEGGALLVIMQKYAAEWNDPDLKQMARDADPTGIANVVESFNAHDCEKLRLTKMPTASHLDCPSRDVGTWCPRYKKYCGAAWFARWRHYCGKTCCPGCDERMTGSKDRGYRGCQTTTRSGRACQYWTAQSPHRHKQMDWHPNGHGLGDHNYCRNPDGEATIWCYTTDPRKRWEYCNPK